MLLSVQPDHFIVGGSAKLCYATRGHPVILCLTVTSLTWDAMRGSVHTTLSTFLVFVNRVAARRQVQRPTQHLAHNSCSGVRRDLAG